MKKTIIPFTLVPQLSKTDLAYACGDPKLEPFFTHAPSLDSFDQAISERSDKVYPRAALADLLEQQYAGLQKVDKVWNNIQALRQDNTFVIATAHQPSLFLGPLYFIYKAITTINVAEAVETRSGNLRRIVPVFVLGSEDHDLEELNKANLFGKTISWEPGVSGPVGSIPAATLADALQDLKTILGGSEAATALFERVERAYTTKGDFTAATQALIHEFLGRFGLVVLNMNNPQLKRFFIPVMKEELLERSTFDIVNNTISELNAAGFKTQAAPREINLFYMKSGMRERIVRDEAQFKVLNTDIVFPESAILDELEVHPEHFSPNVLLRPLFQEIILPNLAYVGGGGELAYWLERKALFAHFKVAFPMLVRRHSVLWLDNDQVKKLEKFDINASGLFGDTDGLVREYIAKNAAVEVSLELESNELRAIYDKLAAKAAIIDPTLEKALRAEAIKALGSFEQWESRLLRAEKQKHEVSINQLRALKEKLFPSNGLQERTDNFLPYILKNGDSFLDELKSSLTPFDPGFVVLEP